MTWTFENRDIMQITKFLAKFKEMFKTQTTKITTITRKAITRQDRLGETPEIGQEDTNEMYSNCVEKKDTQQ